MARQWMRRECRWHNQYCLRRGWTAIYHDKSVRPIQVWGNSVTSRSGKHRRKPLRQVGCLGLAPAPLGERARLCPRRWRDQRPGSRIIQASVSSGSHVYVFVQGSDGSLWVHHLGATWQWSNLGSPRAGIADPVGVAIIGADAWPCVLARSNDGHLWVKRFGQDA